MINRKALVERHHVKLTEFDFQSPLSVGNGTFTYTADITGFQSFLNHYQDIPLCTLSEWGWHSYPNINNVTKDNLEPKYYDTPSRKVSYYTESTKQEDIFNYIRQNPHRFNLAQIGLKLSLSNHEDVHIHDIHDINQTLDLWDGILLSEYKVENKQVSVQTISNPETDILAFSIDSPLIESNQIKIKLAFPYPSHNITASDWNNFDKHQTRLIKLDDHVFIIKRTIDNTDYQVGITVNNGTFEEVENHQVIITPNINHFEMTCHFSQFDKFKKQIFEEVRNASCSYWNEFWLTGGAVELFESPDPRAKELERRIILSRYLTAIQCSGSLPPQETGLTCNSWYGKFHLEMHWWHAIHFPLWGKFELLEKSLGWYQQILPVAKNIAREQGYVGARWPKMVAEAGIDSPSSIGPLLIWQQPHPIYYAETLYKIKPTEETLNKFYEIILETAEFMSSFVEYDKLNDRYILPAPLIPAQENHDPMDTLNPTFELEYWHFGLTTANSWLERLGLPINEKWKTIVSKLSVLPIKDNLYLAHENCPLTFTDFNHDHPSMLLAYGMLKGEKVNKKVMLNTLLKVMDSWHLTDMWGWDFPTIAMCATRLGRPDIAINSLLMTSPKNTYLVNGHNTQLPKKDLPLYLPGNGGLLTAISMMAAGYEGCRELTPGFPKDGSWIVKFENLIQMI